MVEQVAALAPEDPMATLRCELSEEIRRSYNLWNPSDRPSPERIPAIREQARQMLRAQAPDLGGAELERVVGDVVNEVAGLGPLEPLLQDPTVSEVMVNGPRQVYCERRGRIELSSQVFADQLHIRRIIDRILQPIGRSVDANHPMENARLPDGSRVNVVIPPVAVDSPVLTIRKFARERITAEQLVRLGSLTEAVLAYLEVCVRAKLAVAVAGGTGSGKTTLLNVLSAFVPASERLLTIEDVAELQLQQPHVVRLETRVERRGDGGDMRGSITARDLVFNALRMRPDRIIIGEVRGDEVVDLLQALNTGHAGSLTTLHANSALDALHRMENMVALSGVEIPREVVADQIARALQVIVFTSRLAEGQRMVTEVVEILGRRAGQYELRTLFALRENRATGQPELVASGEKSAHMARFRRIRPRLSEAVFEPPPA